MAVPLVLLLAGCGTVPQARVKDTESPLTGVQIVSKPGRLCVSLNGESFTEYHFENTPRPFLYPVLGLTGAGMTRNFPMASPPGEEHDHPHHRSLWFAHGLVNGVDFWTEKPGTGRIVHLGFTSVRGGKENGVIRSRNEWLDAAGKVVCTDDVALTFYNSTATERWFDFEITLHADHGELVLGDSREGTMALRVAETMRVTQADGEETPGSRITNSEGERDTEAWGRRAKWCDYSGPVAGSIAGVALFDHPANPRHPTWWMVRDYGLLAANPFGQHEFEKQADAHAGDLMIPAGGSVTFRYRCYFHTGAADAAKLNERFAEFAAAAGR